MAEIEFLKGAEGGWQGGSKLQVAPEDEKVHESDSFVVISPIILGTFHQISYTWVYENQPQAGLLIVGYNQELDLGMGVWLDSWHMKEQFMHLEGAIDETGLLNLVGSYAVASGPDWGWKIVFDLREDGALNLTMYNISPDGEEVWAVKGEYKRT